MNTIDTRGQTCPGPLIATRKALKDSQTGNSFNVLTDNQTSFNNICRFLNDNKMAFSFVESNGTWTLNVTKSNAGIAYHKTEGYCIPEIPHFSKGNFIIAITSDKMGEGDSELGRQLMPNFIRAVKDLDVLPKAMVFYNIGVALVTEDSPVVEDLKEIERMGVNLLLCSTCVKYYSLEEKIKIGTISNMFEIVQEMASADSVVKP